MSVVMVVRLDMVVLAGPPVLAVASILMEVSIRAGALAAGIVRLEEKTLQHTRAQKFWQTLA